MHPEEVGKYYCVIPVHNRRETTLACLRTLRANGDIPMVSVVVIDDGSTDGTGAAVEREFPEVAVVRGDGGLWWAGAVQRGMDYAVARTDCDGVIWLNDDCRPRPGTLGRLIALSAQWDAISVGESVATDGFVYGGKRRTLSGMATVRAEDGRAVSVDSFSGNCVAIPRGVLDRLGPLDVGTFPHHFADTDYGLRGSRRGVSVLVCPGAICENDVNDGLGYVSWRRDPRPLLEIAKSFRSQKSMMHWPSRRAFYVRHWGGFGWLLAAEAYLRFLLIAVLRTIRLDRPGSKSKRGGC